MLQAPQPLTNRYSRTVVTTVGNPGPIISAGGSQYYFPSMSDLSLLDTSMLVLLEMELTPDESMKRVRHPGGAVRAQRFSEYSWLL